MNEVQRGVRDGWWFWAIAPVAAALEVRASLARRNDRAAEELRGFLDWFEREVIAGD